MTSSREHVAYGKPSMAAKLIVCGWFVWAMCCPSSIGGVLLWGAVGIVVSFGLLFALK